MTHFARISSKGQVTVPAEVRRALDVKSGDSLVWEVKPSGEVIVRRLAPLDVAYLSALEGTLSEWESPEDEEAYRDL